MASPAKPASPAQVGELGKIVFKILGGRNFLGDELGKIVFIIAVVVVIAVAVAVVVAVEAVDKWESYRWCRASPAFAPTQPLPFSLAASVLSRVQNNLKLK